MDGMQMLETFVSRFGARNEFKSIAKSIQVFLAKQRQAA